VIPGDGSRVQPAVGPNNAERASCTYSLRRLGLRGRNQCRDDHRPERRTVNRIDFAMYTGLRDGVNDLIAMLAPR
jgi:hypothetical protein